MMVLKAIVTAEGLAKALLHEVDPIGAAQPYFAMVAAKRLSPERLQQEALYVVLSLSSILERLPVTVSQLLDDVDAQQLQARLVQSVHPLDRRRQRRAQTRWMLAAFAMACLLAGATGTATAVLWTLAAGLALTSLALPEPTED